MTREEIQELRDQHKTFQEIGDIFGVKRQRVHAVYTNYYKKYRQTDKYKMYRRHFLTHGIPGTRPYKPCNYCNLSTRFTNAIA